MLALKDIDTVREIVNNEYNGFIFTNVKIPDRLFDSTIQILKNNNIINETDIDRNLSFYCNVNKSKIVIMVFSKKNNIKMENLTNWKNNEKNCQWLTDYSI